ncbi:MAG: DNA-directed DNA polymerase II small subunit [Candidatus Bathyarchaeia archaeon]
MIEKKRIVLIYSLKEAVEEITLAGYQLEAEAFELLKILHHEEHFKLVIVETINQARKKDLKLLIITRDMIETTLEKLTQEKETTEMKIHPRTTIPFARDIPTEIEILQDCSEETDSSGKIDDFNNYFKDRFQKLSKIIRERLDFNSAKEISYALEKKYGEKVKIIAMVTRRRERTEHLFLDIEDFENTATLMVIREKNKELFEMARRILPDQLIGIEAIHGKGDLLIAEQIVLPDVPERKQKKAKDPINAVLLSDIHIGSTTFCTDAFEKLILWLNGKVGNKKQIEAASRTKYVLIAGDLVDGVGVFPRQEKELSIPDIYQQYKLLAQYIEQIPDYMEVVIIPGNHDAVRQALPQPIIPKDFAEPIYEARDIRTLGNPSEISIHGIHILMYHGRSLDDIIARVPNLSMKTPDKAMEYLLKSRHLAPEYGARTSLAPERKDRLVITNVPDVFQAGHIHVAQNSVYKSTIIVNCGAWQSQTEFQKRMGLDPTPGIMPILNLQTMEVNMMNFMYNEALS